MKLFTTQTCSPCKALKLALHAEDLMGNLELVDDVEQFPKEVRSVPTLGLPDGQYITGMQFILSHLRHRKELEA
ncbi:MULTISPECIES: hypothetical protein [unclassified Marinobacter]|uniref:hypothetical protein n=1 Tax=unclassified Marinobacter TaxID=83889 RepID=UPI0012693E7E|nr:MULTISPECIES: hypothetical protein [unclassified Marinobacter]QFS87609.1 hypothetical protein FIV08_12320 [Marinobacter sp. THAF197a]QFT51394.1 hypothetical protein FIU96_12235 [Marinobacter sp. THAF39]